jgi:ADP-heptose:LPS heptosyltransferase
MSDQLSVIQLGTWAELIDSIPALRGLRKKHSNSKVRLFVRPEYVDFAKTERLADQVIAVGADVAEFSGLKVEGDAIINLSVSEAGGRLAAFLGTNVRGIYVHGTETEMPDGWTRYVISSVYRSQINRLHRTDLFKGIADVVGMEGGAELRTLPAYKILAQKLLLQLRIPFQSRPFMILEPHGLPNEGCSMDEYARVIDTIHQAHPEFFFLVMGGQDDRAANEQLAFGRTGTVYNLSGLVDFQTRLGLYPLAALTIGTPGDGIHLSSAIRAPSLMLVPGKSRYWESAPPVEGQWVLRGVKGVVANDVVVSTAMALVTGNIDALRESMSKESEHRLYVTRKGAYHLHQLQQIAGLREESVEGWYIETYNAVRFEELTGLPTLPSKTLPLQQDQSVSVLETIAQGIEKAYEVAEFGLRYGSLLKREWKEAAPNAQEIRLLGQRLQDVDQTLKGLVKQVPHLGPLIDEFEVEQMSLSLGDAFTTIEKGLESYARLMARSRVLYQKVKSLSERVQLATAPAGNTPPTSKAPVSTVECLEFNVGEVNL